MEFRFIVGVDMSKDWFNYCVMDKKLNIVLEGEVDNTASSIFVFIKELAGELKITKLSELVLCMEHTGVYTKNLVRCWLTKGGRLSIVVAAKVSNLLTGRDSYEEKTDRLDARRLAEYGARFSDKLRLWEARPHALEMLQALQRQRGRLLKALVLLEVPVGESSEFDSASVSGQMVGNQAASVKALREDLKNVEKQLEGLFSGDDELGRMFRLVTSVEGVGPVTAREIIIATVAFTKFTPAQAKMFARYCGLTPLLKWSGKSVRKRGRTSKNANMRMKELLTMGATSLIRRDTELSRYYRRKVGEGKKHLVAVNAVRNKIVHRVFAVVRNQVTYQKNLNVCLDCP